MRNSPNQPKQPSMQDILRLAQTPEGQKIVSALQKRNDPDMKQAMEKALQGDYSQAKEKLSALLSDEEIQRLLGRLGGI